MNASLPVKAQVRRSKRTELLRSYFLNACLIAMAKESGKVDLQRERLDQIEKAEADYFGDESGMLPSGS